MQELDDFDHKIIDALQRNGRLTNIEIAGLVNLSHSSCSRRIARLERDGYIVGYRALTDRRKMGLTLRAFCAVKRKSSVPWKVLADRLSEINNVISVLAVSGNTDILIEIVARDMQHFSDLILKEVSDTEGVVSTSSTFVLDEVKSIY